MRSSVKKLHLFTESYGEISTITGDMLILGSSYTWPYLHIISCHLSSLTGRYSETHVVDEEVNINLPKVLSPGPEPGSGHKAVPAAQLPLSSI